MMGNDFLSKAFAMMDDDFEYEKFLDQLADTAPPPNPQETAQLLGMGMDQVGGQNSMTQPMPQQADPVAELANQFMGAKEPEPYKAQYAPMPGNVVAQRGGNVQVQVDPTLQAAVQAQGQKSANPLESLGALIMKGGA
jgi:hypothetical protein